MITGRVVVAVVALLTAWPASVSIADDGVPQLRPTQHLPADVAAEVATTWARFVDTLGDRIGCVDDVWLTLVPEVPGGDARYLVTERHVEIAIPTSPARFRDSLAHELAHHLDHTCDEIAPLRLAFARHLDRRTTSANAGPAGAAGDPGDTPEGWSGSGPWEEQPAELFAEAIVQRVNGERVRFGRTMAIPAAAAAEIDRWIDRGP